MANLSVYDVVETFALQPALVTLFHRRASDDKTAKEAIKEHLWALHFDEYGRSGHQCVTGSFSIFIIKYISINQYIIT